ncbi:MAG TPA: hypothetical protein VM911_13185 [Pyrinomonadaceae bacterium]|jgi:hypothetical protein|nr:hypothetical protein [Pyrinomonadaceae bacterium]
MKLHTVLRATVSLLVFGWALLTIPSLYGQQPRQQIAAQADQLESILKAAPASEQVTYDLQRLERARSALKSGYLYASLYYLQTVMAHAAGRQYVESKKELEKAGFDAFEKEWQLLGPQLSQEEKGLTEARLNALPAAVRALVQTAQEQSRSYYQAGRLYARETTVPYGLHYIGEAKGLLAFANWGAGLRFPQSPSWKGASPDSEISELEKEILKSYQRPDATKQQELFNEINSQLNFAQILTRKGKSVAALQTYLEASRLYSLLDPPNVQPSDSGKFQEQARAVKARLDAGQLDQSVGRMYWEIVQLKLDAADDNKLAETDARQVSIILDKVLPRYFQYLGNNNAAATAPPAAATAHAKVKVTLVRWPYT